jgi:hypothetical protein
VLGLEVLIGVVGIVTVRAEQFPYREPGPYRTAFVESATKACMKANLGYPGNVGVPNEAMERLRL